MRVEYGKAIPSHKPVLGIDWDWEALVRTIVYRSRHGRTPAMKAGA